MLSKWQKIKMYLIGLFSMLLALMVIVPFRAIWPANDLYTLEFIIKLILIPITILLLSIEPTILKYRQIMAAREQSKVISVMSYFPLASYLIGLLIHGVYTLSKGVQAFLDHGLGMGVYSLWLVIMMASIVFLAIAVNVFYRFEMQLDLREHIIFDLCFFTIMLFFIVLSNKINSIYREFFVLHVPDWKGEIVLFVIFLASAIGFGVYLARIGRLVSENEVLISLNPKTLEEENQRVLQAEYNRAYNDILVKFESSYMEHDFEEIEELVEEDIVDAKTPEKETKAKKATLHQVTEELEPEIVEVVEEVIIPVDPEKIAALEIQKEKLALAKKLIASQEEEIALKQKEIDDKKKKQAKDEVVPKPEPLVRVVREPVKIIPSFKVVTNYAKSIPGITVIESEDKKRMRFTVGKKVFLIANETTNDYRFTFLYDLSKIVALMIKYPIVVKAKTPKGDNWFKLTNKGDFTEEDLYAIIDTAHATLQLLEEQKLAERKAARAQKKAKV